MNHIKKIILSLLLSSFCHFSFATPMISTDIEGLGGDYYLFDFTLTNAGPDYAFAGFDILFSDTSFNGLVIDTSPVGWASDALTPFPPFDPFYHASWGHGPDIFTLSDILLPTAGVMDGFSAVAHYIGSADISDISLGFSFFDPFFTPKFEGDGSVSVSSYTPFASIPEPTSLLLLGVGLLAIVRKRLS